MTQAKSTEIAVSRTRLSGHAGPTAAVPVQRQGAVEEAMVSDVSDRVGVLGGRRRERRVGHRVPISWQHQYWTRDQWRTARAYLPARRAYANGCRPSAAR